MKRMLRLCLLPLILLLGGGCASTGDGPPPSVYHLGLPAEAAIPRFQTLAATLLLEKPEADAGFTSRAIAYRRSPYELSYYSRSRWADSPARMIEPALVTAMERSGLFQAVLRAPTSARADYRLDTELLRLQQVLKDGRAEAQLALRVQLVDNEKRRVVASRIIEASAPAEPDAAGAVAATHRALAEVLAQTTAFVASALAARPMEN